jgi:hypothetical protein
MVVTLCSPSMRCSACFGSEPDRFSRELTAFISNASWVVRRFIANGDGRAAPRLHLVQLGTGPENFELP